MALINVTDVSLSFGDIPILDHVNLYIEANERICIVGRNGAGKSTLLKVLNNEIVADDGRVVYSGDLIVSHLAQDPPCNVAGSLYDFVAEGVVKKAELLKRYHAISKKISCEPSRKNLEKLAELQAELDHQDGWQIENRINNILSQLHLDPDANLSSLSGGWLRKAALAKAMVCNPNVLLLDEPTNHLDIDTIEWLEAFLKNFNGSLVFISHDRAFIRNMATRIIDLDRGIVTSYVGDYEKYLLSKEAYIRIEALQNSHFDKKLAQEEAWIRKGIKARRTRNEGRVSALKAMRREYAQRRQSVGNAKMQVAEASQSGKIIFDIDCISYAVGDKKIVNHFSAKVIRGDKIALIGPNGCGKTTLLKLMLAQLTPDDGKLHCGTKLEVAYFDQYRSALNFNETVIENLAEGKQEITVNGRQKHVSRYLQDFLFSPKRAMTPVSTLSGGERHRLLLAKLFIKPSNVLILDEPTNDLDVETLELLEELVSEYEGTVLLVSHDRQFVDNSVTQCWIFQADGNIAIFPGGYYDARNQQTQSVLFNQKKRAHITKSSSDKVKKNVFQHEVKIKQCLSYKQRQKLDLLPKKIAQLEEKISELQIQINDITFFNQPHEVTHPILTALADYETKLERAYTCWEELEKINDDK